jgi:signal transduction histidine kinase
MIKSIFAHSLKLSIFLIISLLSLKNTYSQERTILIKKADQENIIGRQIEVFEDKTAKLSFEQVRKSAIDARFIQSLQTNPNFGVTNSVIWARFTIQNLSTEKLFLEIAEPIIDSLSLYKIDSSKSISISKSGIYTHQNSRQVHTNFYLLDLQLAPQQTCTYYIRFQNSLPMIFPMRVAGLKVFFEDNHSKDLLQGMYLGLMLVMAIFNFFIFWTNRSREYLYYVLYVLSFAAFFSYQKGLSHEFLWGSQLWVNHVTPVFISCVIIFGIMFAEAFLNAPAYYTYSRKVTKIFIILIGVFLTLHIAGMGAISTSLLYFTAFFGFMYVLFLAIYVWLEGSQAALFFLGAWSIMLVSAMIFLLQLANILPSDYFSRNALQVGSALEVVLLSFALAYRINAYRKEKEHAQAESIKQLQENEQIRNRIARDLHDDIGSTLSSIGILSQVVEYQIDRNPAGVRDLIKRINDSSQKVQRALSDIVWTTRHTSENFGELLVKMREFIAEVLEPKFIYHAFKTDDLPDVKLSPSKQYHFYLIFKETVNNIVKYSKAIEVSIEIIEKDNYLIMTIEDDGIGFDEEKIKAGNGLANMRKRASQMDGTIEISSVPDEGTKTCLKIPLYVS